MNVIILNSEKACGKVATCFASSDTKKKKLVLSNCLVETDIANSARINCLSRTVDVLKQLTENKNFTENTEIKVFTIGLVADIVNKGTFKKWLRNGGVRSDGTKIPEVELQLWRDFFELFQNNFNSIEIYNVKVITSHKQNKGNYQNNRYSDFYSQSEQFYSSMNSNVKAMWDKIMIVQQQAQDTFEQGFFS